jgi:flavodoxin
LYSSRSGNTEKIAREISSELDCRCEKIGGNFDSCLVDLDNFDLVFLGTGNYGAKPNAELLDYLKEMNLNGNRIFALFMTWVGRGTTDKAVYDIIKAAVEEKGQRLMEHYYSCLFQGHSRIARVMFPSAKGHPRPKT